MSAVYHYVKVVGGGADVAVTPPCTSLAAVIHWWMASGVILCALCADKQHRLYI